MTYGTVKTNDLVYSTVTGDVTVAVSGIAIQGAAVISGVSGVFTTSVSGATVTGNAGQFGTLTGNTAQFTSVTGVTGIFTTSVSGATVAGTTITGTSGLFTTITAQSGIFTSQISGAVISGDTGSFSTISGGLGFFSNTLSVPSGSATSPSISINGDPNTGLYSPGADQVAISTNGTGRLTVSTTAVSSTLAVDHPLGAVGTPSITFTGDLNTGFWSPAADTLAASTGGSERLRILSDGKVGLGTSSPSSKLYVNEINLSAPSTTYGATAGQTFKNELSELAFGADTSAPYAHWLQARFSTNAGQPLSLNPLGGNVGIGTAAPDDPLHIASSAPVIRLQDTDLTNTFSRIFHDGAALWLDSRSNTDDGQFIFRGLGGGTAKERARIDSSGRLLVGTSSAYQVGGFSRSAYICSIASENNTHLVVGASGTSGFPALYFTRTRTNLAKGDASTAVENNDTLGIIEFYGANGTDFSNRAASVICAVDGEPFTSGDTTDLPGRLVFSTTADGSASPTERVRISQNGVVTIKNGAVAEIGTLTDSATITPDFAANCNFTATISGGSRTVANPTNVTAGQSGSIFIIQGAGTGTISWGSSWDFTGGTAPTLSTASGAIDRVDYVVRTSTSIHTVFTADYS
jgi:hypothetical protein